MEWLLTLFAILGAVTGADGGVRGEQAQIHRAEAASPVQVAAAAAEATAARETPAVPARKATPGEVHSPANPCVAAAVPLYADRLLE